MHTTDTKKTEAISHAEREADRSMIPQTIFRNEDSAGWWHTNPFASLLKRSEVYMSVLPSRYFRR